MKRLIADIYKIIYHITHVKSLSFIVALVYVTALNLISIYGLALLLSTWLPTKIILKLFVFPYSIIISALILLLNFQMIRPLKNMHNERKKMPFYPSIIAYTLITIILCLYIHYRNIIF
jgi:hypothetical protein